MSNMNTFKTKSVHQKFGRRQKIINNMAGKK